jgi:uncharacterized protein (TIGR02444 family)
MITPASRRRLAEPGSPFWNFSLRVYRRPGVPEACLALQDSAGADVNILLFLLWQASQGRTLEAADLAAIETLVGDWRRDVVIPLRTVRRTLKPLEADPAVAALRAQVKQSELAAERVQQEMLYRDGRDRGRGPVAEALAARHNVALYAAQLGTDLSAPALATLLGAAALEGGSLEP